MTSLRKITNFFLVDTYGNIALASFLICVLSGVVLTIPYDVMAAYDSISLILITNLPGVIFRNMHYWSAQFFLIFTLLHILQTVKQHSASNLEPAVWVRTVFSILFVFFVMISGFILKGDADSQQAYRIMENLLGRIPLAGEFLISFLFGAEDSLQLIYVHHIATATIFLIYVLYEHTGVLWTKRSTFLILLAIFTLLSFTVHAPLHDNINPVLKGPWYFIGLQEMLHWTGRPGWAWFVIVILLLLVYLSFYSGTKTNRILYNSLLLLTGIYLVLTVIGYWFRGENWEWENPWDKKEKSQTTSLEFGIRMVSQQFSDLTANDIAHVQGKYEACLNCHTGMSGFSPSHNPEALGCTSCHLGNPFTLDKQAAHRNMILIPGNLNEARLSCGTTQCHPDISQRIQSSLMTTNSGIVSVDRFVFGEQDSPDNQAHIQEIGFSSADKHLRDLCANCHLGHEKIETGPIDQLSRGGGCNACHLNYSPDGEQQHNAYLVSGKNEEHLPDIHPSLDLNITNDHCFGCHSRSGRISTNYEGWHETLLEKTPEQNSDKFRVLQDKRVFEYISEDIHHQGGMVCIDCHNSYEVMGDGNYYLHEEQAVKIRCEDCHFHESSNLATYSELDVESKKIFDLREFSHGDKMMIKGKQTKTALINTFLEDGKALLVSKNSGQILPMNPPNSICTQDFGHKNVSCNACHTTWAPSCIGCHNSFDPKSQGYDLLDSRMVQGEWVEYVGEFIADEPALGVRNNGERLIEPAVPGMIMTIDNKNYTSGSEEDVLFHRLYAPVVPHTTGIKGRNCKSCHTNPVALGYGRGKLLFTIEGEKANWTFQPAYAANEHDGLPEDAWIAFGSSAENELESNVFYSTRTDFRPFNPKEQYRILRVGLCLQCHGEDSSEMINSLTEDFDQYITKISDQCILPE